MKKSKYKYAFSVIMCIYNVEKYLEEAIESIINQNVNFEKDIQLILVNDGSPDNSEEICLRYQKMYPNNILYKKKSNGGLASAKNFGLKFIEGRYISFFDSDDILPTNVFKEVFKFFKKNELCVDFVTIPLELFGAETGLHSKYKYMGNKNRIINLDTEPYNFVLSGAASFYKNDIFNTFRFDEDFVGEEDSLLNGLIYLKNPRFGYVCEKGVVYNYRKREEQNSIVDRVKFNPESYKTVIKLLEKIIPDDNLREYQKELIIYELRSRYKNIENSLFDKKIYDIIIKKYNYYINKLDINYIIYHSKYCDTPELKYFFGRIIDDNFCMKTYPEEFNNLYRMSTITIYYQNIKENTITLHVGYNKFNENIELVVFDEKNNIILPVEKKDYESCFDLYVGENNVDITHISKFEFKLTDMKKIKFILFDNMFNRYIPPKRIMVSNRTVYNSFLRKCNYKKYEIEFDGRKLIIQKIINKKFNIFIRKISDIYKIYKSNHVLALTRLFSRRNKRYVLINDRLDKAGDNGEALFKYIYANEPTIAKNTYYVIGKDCNDYKRLKKYGKVVKIGSLKHKILFLNAKYIYSSHTMPQFYNAYDIELLSLYRDLLNYKFIWLQHGITQNDISKAANKYRKGIDFITTCTNQEFNEFCKCKYGYDDGEIILTGFSRYDLLESHPKNIITIAPTWRRGFGISEPKRLDFKNSDYYLNYSKLLSNERLKNIISEKNITIHFILHPEMKDYISDFKSLENSNIKIIEQENVSYNKMFAESKLLITDYSSVFFDFAYLRKPEIFFQFDKEYFFKNHYKKGYFNFDTDAFGEVLTDPEQVVEKIEYYINNDYKMEEKYLKIISNTFKYTDKNNCKRIIEKTYK